MAVTGFVENLIRTPATIARLINNVNTQKAFIKKHILPDLEEAKKTNDGSLEEKDFKKITGYYGLAVPAIVGESYAILRNYPLTERERAALTYLGAITGLFDDFFDKDYLHDEKIRLLMETPGALTGENSSQKLFLHFYKKAIDNVEHKDLLLHYFKKVFEAQIKSKKQAGPGLSEKEIFDITIEKGGVSVLFYRAALSNNLIDNEEKALYQTGGFMQLGNDIYDIYKDRNHGIYTLPTTTKDIAELRTTFLNQLKYSQELMLKLGYEKKHTRYFLRLMSLYLCSRCYVFFDQLEKKQKETGNVFKPAEYSRQVLVCDMEKTSNKFRTLGYHLRFMVPNTPKLP
jgi:hypothetical protein